MRHMNQSSFGFTLIELLVVVVIMGVLAAVAVPQYQKTVERVRLSEAFTVIRTLEKSSHALHWNQSLGVDEVLNLPCNNGCRSKHFVYMGYIEANAIHLEAYRAKNADLDNMPEVLLIVNGGENEGERVCVYNPTNSFYKSFCQEMEKKGWIVDTLF